MCNFYQDLVKINPKFNFDDDMNMTFDLGLELAAKDLGMPEFPDCLPAPVSTLWWW